MSFQIPSKIKSVKVRQDDQIRIVTVDRLDVGALEALPAHERSKAYLAENWVIKTPARIPARDEYRRNAAARVRKAPVAEPMAVIEDLASGHEWIAEAKIEGTTLAKEFLATIKKQDAAGFEQRYQSFRSPFDDLATLFFVKLGLIADLRLCNVYDTQAGLMATDAWLEDCSDRRFKHFSDYHPERTFNHLLLALPESETGKAYTAQQDWLLAQIAAVDPSAEDQAQRYCRKLRALRATYGLI